MDVNAFKEQLEKGLFQGFSVAESDSILAGMIGSISNFSESGDAVDCSFQDISSAVEFALDIKKGSSGKAGLPNPAANQAAALAIAAVKSETPSLKAILARAALIRAFNRRARLALPWMSVRPCQEGSALFGGLCGHGASTERSGRTRLQASQELVSQLGFSVLNLWLYRHLTTNPFCFPVE